MTHNLTTIVRLLTLWGAAWILSTALGCGGHEPSAVLDAADLLERYDKVRQQNDPATFSEFELPEQFVVTKRGNLTNSKDAEGSSQESSTAIFVISFKVCAVVADEDMVEFTELVTTHGERLSHLIQETVRDEEVEDLGRADLGMLKYTLTKCINQCLGKPLVRSVVFSEFQFER